MLRSRLHNERYIPLYNQFDVNRLSEKETMSLLHDKAAEGKNFPFVALAEKVKFRIACAEFA